MLGPLGRDIAALEVAPRPGHGLAVAAHHLAAEACLLLLAQVHEARLRVHERVGDHELRVPHRVQLGQRARHGGQPAHHAGQVGRTQVAQRAQHVGLVDLDPERPSVDPRDDRVLGVVVRHVAVADLLRAVGHGRHVGLPLDRRDLPDVGVGRQLGQIEHRQLDFVLGRPHDRLVRQHEGGRQRVVGAAAAAVRAWLEPAHAHEAATDLGP